MTDSNGTKKHQWTVTFSYQKNGISVSENYTERNDDWEELVRYKKVILDHLPNSQAFPNDSGPVATPPEAVREATPDWCHIHGIKMKKYTKGDQSWYSHKIGDSWCTGKAK